MHVCACASVYERDVCVCMRVCACANVCVREMCVHMCVRMCKCVCMRMCVHCECERDVYPHSTVTSMEQVLSLYPCRTAICKGETKLADLNPVSFTFWECGSAEHCLSEPRFLQFKK